MKTLRNAVRLPLCALFIFLPGCLFAQVSLDGTVDSFEYVGAQPMLINGVSSAPAVGKPLVRHVYMARNDTMVIVIDERACILSNLKPYRPQEGDMIKMSGFHGLTKLLVRNGEPIGYLNGRGNEWYRPFNDMSGEKIDVDWVSKPENFEVTSPNDPRFRNATVPLRVFRKSVPQREATRLRESATRHFSIRHYVYLQMPASFVPGANYTVVFKNYERSFQKDVSFVFNDDLLRSESIHVNLLGYGTEDRKVAFLSSWAGDGGVLRYPEGLEFRVVNADTKETVFRGRTSLKQSADEPEYVIDGEGYNHNKTDVYILEFSSVDEEGSYRVVVDGIGCSFDFRIDRNIWEDTASVLMKGFLHQRAGMEVGPPFTNYVRPRNLHPEDGHTIHKCDPERFFAGRGDFRDAQSSIFEAIRTSILEETSVPEAWGGWLDAGDFDRRMEHLYTVRRMMLLYESNPAYFEQCDYGIPESKNDIPDILGEALWCLDLFKRTQGVYEEGGVSWWIESIEHPRQGEASWTNSLPTAIVPPTPEAGLNYAGTAAHMALILEDYDREKASEYEKSALAAMAWLERNSDAPFVFVSESDRLSFESYAYINLYRLTRDETWHQRFKENLNAIFPTGMGGGVALEWISPDIDGFDSLGKIDPMAVYSLMDASQVDVDLQAGCQSAIVALADELLDGAEGVTYGTFRLKGRPVSHLVTMNYKVLPIVVSHRMTGDPKYVDALVAAVQYTMGLNPMNRSYISGLGERSFVPYHHDWHTDNLPIPAGIPNFGPILQTREAWGWSSQAVLEKLAHGGLYPATLYEWPTSEKCFNQMWYPPVNEFMVQSPMGELLLLSGYLAAYSVESDQAKASD